MLALLLLLLLSALWYQPIHTAVLLCVFQVNQRQPSRRKGSEMTVEVSDCTAVGGRGTTAVNLVHAALRIVLFDSEQHRHPCIPFIELNLAI